ncbi:MAG: hypothetical protein JO093_12425 [Acidobacteria bacterium]|nr:hypothetical protein [Acidobacteriota bacterium]MBV9068161.1 hypothetical protein [Acidobacteriota bacterium]MBV9186423.1 hypothetical protein [Acidobacteriota bacterium]
MELPGTFTGILIAVFAVLPGLPGEKLYSFFVGSNWREDRWSRTLRLLAFSLFGLAGYALVAALVGAPLPQYISPTAFEQLAPNQLGAFAAAFLGHVCGATFFGLLAGVGTRVLARLSSRSAYSIAWDHFINSCVKGHWVTVGLTNGDVYAGYIETAESSVAAAERDVVLREPALYDQRLMRYRSLPYQSLFLLASTIASVAVIFDAATDKRMTRIGESPFAEGGNDGIGED